MLLDWLNNDGEIAWIVPVGPKQWKTVSQLSSLKVGQNFMWHVPSGPLPLVYVDGKVPFPGRPDWMVPNLKSRPIEDPWTGWTEIESCADLSQPWFGGAYPGVVELLAKSAGRDKPGSIGFSCFGWLANMERCIGIVAHESTERWWRRLQRRISKISIKIPREGLLDGPDKEIWAMPSAHERIQNGAPRDLNPMPF